MKTEKDGKNHNFQIETRQKTEELFSTDTPLSMGSSENLDTRLVLGYALVAFFGISDAPFSVVLSEDCEEGGTFPATSTLTALLVNGAYIVCERVAPCGSYMRAQVTSTGAAQSYLELCGRGIPIA